MAWIARLAVLKKTLSHMPALVRHRRGDIVGNVKEALSLPSGPIPLNPLLVYVYVTDVPDHLTPQIIGEWLSPQLQRTSQGVVYLSASNDLFVTGETIQGTNGTTAMVDGIQPTSLGRELIVSAWTGRAHVSNAGLEPDVGSEITQPTTGGSGIYQRFEPVFLARCRRFIPTSKLPANWRNTILANGWNSTDFTTAKGFIRQRPPDTEPGEANNNKLDNESIDDEEAPV